MNKLSEIINWKRKEIAERSRPINENELLRFGDLNSTKSKFSENIRAKNNLSLIAEIKRQSPSAGTISNLENAIDQARKYYNANTDAISVLTDNKYFGGNIKDLWEVTDFINSREDSIPILRKDFFIDPIQILETAESGASLILIIVSALNDEEINRLYQSANMAGMEALFEIHDEFELEKAVEADAKIIGVNNRNLKDFSIDLSVSENLLPKIPEDIIKISESGIKNFEDAKRVFDSGAQAVLVGQALMEADDPAKLIMDIQNII